MPFISDAITVNHQQRFVAPLREALVEFEKAIQAPVRIQVPEAGRTVERATAAWSGASSDLRHYEGFTKEDCDTKGVTIFLASWNSAVSTGEARYWYQYFGREFYAEMAAHRESAEIELRSPEDITSEKVEEAGGIPFMTAGAGQAESVFAELYDGRVLFFRPSMSGMFRYGTPDWNKLLFDPILENSTPELREAARVQREEAERHVFVQLMKDQGNLAITELRERAAEVGQNVGLTAEKLVNERADYADLNKQLANLLAEGPQMTDEDIAEEWQTLTRHKQIERFALGQEAGDIEGVTNRYLKLFTKYLYLEHPRTHRQIPIGKLEITLNFGRNNIRIANKSQKHGGYDHPHVSHEQICEADFRTTFTELLRQRKLASLSALMFNVLDTLNMVDPPAVNNAILFEEADDANRRLKGWPEWEEGETKHPQQVEEEEAENGTDNDDNTDGGDDTDAK